MTYGLIAILGILVGFCACRVYFLSRPMGVLIIYETEKSENYTLEIDRPLEEIKKKRLVGLRIKLVREKNKSYDETKSTK